MASRWTAPDMPDQAGRTAIVTGANSGLGRVIAHELAGAGAQVVMTSRDPEKGNAAASAIRAKAPSANLVVSALDLADLSSVRAFSEHFLAGHDRLDLLINNAGVMAAPYRRTVDGFELQLGTNHLGHFALTGLLLAALRRQSGARVVTVSSNEHKAGVIQFDDLAGQRRYARWAAYRQSKLANLLFALELDRRLRAARLPLISVAAHPGYSATNLQLSGPPLHERIAMRLANRLFAQSAEMGALPILYAATAPSLGGGSYIGPDGPWEIRGYPTLVRPSQAAQDVASARRLWSTSEQLTGVSYDLPAPAAR